MSLKRFKIRIKETVASVIAEEEFFPVAIKEVIRQREILESYISKSPSFLYSLTPVPVSEDSPEIIRRMARASWKAGVGPMASVAGAIAFFAVREMVKRGARQVIFENGGDIAMSICEPVIVGIYAGERIKSLALKIHPRKSIIGICTSSGKMGHSLSFGRADSVTVISADPILADAVATALGNSIKEEIPEKIQEAIERYLFEGIETIIVIMGELVGLGGQLPELIESEVPAELLTIA